MVCYSIGNLTKMKNNTRFYIYLLTFVILSFFLISINNMLIVILYIVLGSILLFKKDLTYFLILYFSSIIITPEIIVNSFIKTIAVYDVFLLMLIFRLFLFKVKEIYITKTQLSILLILFCIMMGNYISFLLLDTNEFNIRYIIIWVKLLLLLFVFNQVQKVDFNKIYKSIMLLIFTTAILGILEHFKVDPFYEFVKTSFVRYDQVLSTLRTTSTYANPNYFGLFIGVLIIFLLVFNRKPVIKLFIIGVSIFALYTTFSRTSIVALTITILVYLLIKKKIKTIIVISLVFFGSLALFWSKIIFFFTNMTSSQGDVLDRSDSITGRLGRWTEGINKFESNFFLPFNDGGTFDNFYLHFLFSGGILAFLVCIFFLLIFMCTTLKSNKLDIYQQVLIYCFIFASIHALATNSFFMDQYMYLIFSLIGIIFNSERKEI